jgi:hypothetical protein
MAILVDARLGEESMHSIIDDLSKINELYRLCPEASFLNHPQIEQCPSGCERRNVT